MARGEIYCAVIASSNVLWKGKETFNWSDTEEEKKALSLSAVCPIL